eukprot:COSAG01_NODE_2791_length_7069_cov_11.407174_3_plen_269_part_00
MRPGTRVKVGELGEGVYERFERCQLGCNNHHIRFATGVEAVELRKIATELWTVLPEPLPADPDAPAAGAAALPGVAQSEPEPEPAAAAQEEAEPPALDVWLAQTGLDRYGPQVKEYGYDTLSALLVATEADIVEMTEDADVGMKKPHRRLFTTQWQALVGAGGGGGGSSGGGAAAAAEQSGGSAGPAPASAAGGGGGDADAVAQFAARCIAFAESDSSLLGPIRGLFDDKANPRVSIQEAVKSLPFDIKGASPLRPADSLAFTSGRIV